MFHISCNYVGSACPGGPMYTRSCMLPKVSYNMSVPYGHGCRMIYQVLLR